MRITKLAALAAGVLPLAIALTACGGGAAPASTAAQAGPAAAKVLFIDLSTVQGSNNVAKADQPLQSCVLQSRFPRNSEIVWRARIWDPVTGKEMDDKSIAQAQIKLASGTSIDMKYGLHPKDTGPGFWTGSWMVPKDAPTGTLKYTVTAIAKDGRTGQYAPLDVAPSLPAITDKVLPDIPTSPAASASAASKPASAAASSK